MNQDQVKEKLVQLKKTKADFTVTFTGKSSKKANGLYYPDRQEIIIHNANFSNENNLMYTAIHEYAHHVHFTESSLPVSKRAHTTEFWSIFHKLLARAEHLGIYINVFDNNDEFRELTKRIKSEFLKVNGTLVKDLGKVLIEAEKLCRKFEVSFTDYLDRVLCIPRDSARAIIKTQVYDVPPEIGYDNMRTVVSFSDEAVRQKVQEAFLEGHSPDTVKFTYKAPRKKDKDEIEILTEEKESIERRIARLHERLAVIEQRLEEAGAGENVS